MRALVTGGAGFVGSHLVDRLLAEGHAVEVVDDLSTGSLANLGEARANANRSAGELKFHHLDVQAAELQELLGRRRPTSSSTSCATTHRPRSSAASTSSTRRGRRARPR